MFLVNTIPGVERPLGYPQELESQPLLKDGSQVLLRPVVPADALALEHALQNTDSESLYQRFFTPRPRFSPQHFQRLTHMDYVARLALVVVAEGEVAGVARYESADGSGEAEMGVMVHKAWRNQGVAAILLRSLETAAQGRGIEMFRAFYLQNNPAIARLLQRFGYSEPTTISGVIETSKTLALA